VCAERLSRFRPVRLQDPSRARPMRTPTCSAESGTSMATLPYCVLSPNMTVMRNLVAKFDVDGKDRASRSLLRLSIVLALGSAMVAEIRPRTNPCAFPDSART